MRSFLFLVTVLFLASCASAPLKLKAVPGDYVAESPRMQVGDRWMYEGSMGEITETEVVQVLEDGGYKLKVTLNKNSFYYVTCDKNHKIVSSNKSDRETDSTNIESRGSYLHNELWNFSEIIDFPLFVGKKFKKKVPGVSIVGGKGGRFFKEIDFIFRMKVTELVEKELFDKPVHVFTINYKVFRVSDGHSWRSSFQYSPELKSLVNFTPFRRQFAELAGYRVDPQPLNRVELDYSLTPIESSPEILAYGYDNIAVDDAAIARMRVNLEAERARLAKEKANAKALRAKQLAETEALTAQKIAEAERLAQEKIAAAAREAEERQKKLLAAAEERARKLLEEQKIAALSEKEKQKAEREAKRLAAIKKAEEDNRYGVAVIIGNRNYAQNNPDVPNVDYAHNDAEAMYTYVKDTLGYKEGNIIYIKDATQAALSSVFGNERSHRGKLFNWVQKNKSKVFVYYSGHGAPGLSDGSGYLLPVNADPTAVELNGYPLATLYENLAKVPARQITVVLDACFSGSSASGNLVKNASSIALRRVKTEGVLENGAVLTAAAVSEVASWDQNRKMGLFTAQFLEGVSGAADRDEFGDGDGQVSLGELKNYLQTRVSYQARRNYYREQNPQVSGDEKLVLNYYSGKNR